MMRLVQLSVSSRKTSPLDDGQRTRRRRSPPSLQDARHGGRAAHPQNVTRRRPIG